MLTPLTYLLSLGINRIPDVHVLTKNIASLYNEYSRLVHLYNTLRRTFYLNIHVLPAIWLYLALDNLLCLGLSPTSSIFNVDKQIVCTNQVTGDNGHVDSIRSLISLFAY